jgi:hypothetical protein
MLQFSELFAGRTETFGIYTVLDEDEGGKSKGRGITYPNSRFPDRKLEDSDWENHLEGVDILGVVPILPDGYCNWFALDIDDYKLNHKGLVHRISKFDLPLVMCRSKSGGAHLFCFVKGKIKGTLAIQLCKKWRNILGYRRAEIFPKQTVVDAKIKGSWLSLPYFKKDDTTRYAFDSVGNPLNFEDFIQYANASLITEEEGRRFLSEGDVKDDLAVIEQTPPCILKMFEDGIDSGGRNNAMIHIGIYYRKLDDEFKTTDYQDKIKEANDMYCSPPLSEDELMIAIKQSANYFYLCNHEPMASLCNKEVCMRRKFGIGPDVSFYGSVIFDKMVKIDSAFPIWIISLRNKHNDQIHEIKVDTKTLMDPGKMRIVIAERANLIIPRISVKKHDEIMSPLMHEALIIEDAEELTGESKVTQAFKEWTANVLFRSKDKENLNQGLPFFDKDSNTILFRAVDFIKVYREKFKENLADRQVWAYLRDAGFSRKQVRLGKTGPEWIWCYRMRSETPWFEIREDKF